MTALASPSFSPANRLGEQNHAASASSELNHLPQSTVAHFRPRSHYRSTGVRHYDGRAHFARANIAGCSKPSEGVYSRGLCSENGHRVGRVRQQGYHMVQGKPTLQGAGNSRPHDEQRRSGRLGGRGRYERKGISQIHDQRQAGHRDVYMGRCRASSHPGIRQAGIPRWHGVRRGRCCGLLADPQGGEVVEAASIDRRRRSGRIRWRREMRPLLEPAKPRRSKAETESRAAELQATAAVTNPATSRPDRASGVNQHDYRAAGIAANDPDVVPVKPVETAPFDAPKTQSTIPGTTPAVTVDQSANEIH